MKVFSNVKLGLITYVEAIKFIFTNGLWYFFIFPVGLWAAIYFIGVWLEQDLQQMESVPEPENIREIMSVMLNFALKTALVHIAFKFTKYIIFVCMSPLLAIMSEKVEKILTGNVYKFNLKQLLKDIKRGIKIALRNMAIEYSLVLAWIVLTMIVPSLSDYTFTVLLCVGFYFYGFAMIDYINERRRLNIDESIRFVRKNRGLAIANGAVFSLLFLIPYDIGVMFAPVLSIVAATIAMHHLVDLNTVEYAVKKNS